MGVVEDGLRRENHELIQEWREGEKARTNTGKLCAMILEYLQEREVEINHWVLQASRSD